MTTKPRHFGWYELRDDGKVNISVQGNAVDQDVWDEYETTVQVTADIRPLIIDCLSLEAEYTDLCKLNEELSKQASSRKHPFSDIGVLPSFSFSKAQRKIFNFLNAAHAFRDRTIRRLIDEYGNESQQHKNFTERTSELFDASFSYRLMYYLRNHAQHHASPVSLIPHRGVRTGDGPIDSYDVEIKLKTDELLKSLKKNAKFRDELKRLDYPTLDLMDHCDEYMDCMKILMREQIENFAPRLFDLTEYAKALSQAVPMPKAAIPVIWEGDIVNVKGGVIDGEVKAKVNYFSFDELILINRLYERFKGPKLVDETETPSDEGR